MGAEHGGGGDGGMMSWTSRASSALGFRRASGRSDMDSRSHVAYTESLMTYEPPKMYHCRTARKHGGCGFVEFHDDPLPKFFSDLIGDLRDEVRRLKGGGFVARIEDPNPNVPLLGHEAVLENAGSIMSPKV
ncbi:hypothetical protein D1007_10456 [Hordeum vulgare]|nr:hypothetical protein D1007_10456 [Hordeum vulgare]